MILRRTLLATLAATSVARADEPLTIRFGFANVGVDNRQFSGGNFIAAAHAEYYIETDLKDLPGVKVEYAFFKGAGPAVNEAFANASSISHRKAICRRSSPVPTV
jgi:sulfonate transport system substrate-binding protein